MKSHLALGLLILAACSAPALRAETGAGAGEKPAKEQRADKRRDRSHDGRLQELVGQLDLTPDQRARLQPLFQQFRSDAEALRDNPDLGRDEKMQELKGLRETLRTSVSAVLSPTQRDQLATLQRDSRRKDGDKPKAP